MPLHNNLYKLTYKKFNNPNQGLHPFKQRIKRPSEKIPFQTAFCSKQTRNYDEKISSSLFPDAVAICRRL